MAAVGYHYIVVGAGSAGCVLAARLTERPEVRVLLLEAGGGDGHPWLKMPLAFRNAGRMARFNWNYYSEPEPGLGGRSIRLSRGKLLGGSSSINAMAYVRGHPLDYDQWRQMGCTGWSYDDVLPYFRRLETNWRGATAEHGGDGPIQVSRSVSPLELWDVLRDTAVAAGYPEREDYTVSGEEGVGRAELTVGRGHRSSTSTAYLRPAMTRPNLVVETRALTTRVIVANGRAIGVAYRQAGRLHQAYADAEVILCGGTYNSPQLLMLSGIGPADHLREVGIAPVLDLPGVGRNLSEHPFVRLEYATARPVTFVNQIRFDRAARSTLRWALLRDGPFTTAGATGRIFARTRPGLDRPDVMFTFSPVQWGVEPWFPLVRPAPEHRVTSGVQVLHEESRGVLRLRSDDPADPPRIHLALFARPADMDTMLRGIRRSRELFAHEPLVGLIAAERLPGAASASDSDLEAFVRANAMTAQHPVGTCSMGTGPEAVVDPELRVHGTAGLRVIDASVMPAVPGGNINAPTIMIAEKGADLVRGIEAA